MTSRESPHVTSHLHVNLLVGALGVIRGWIRFVQPLSGDVVDGGDGGGGVDGGSGGVLTGPQRRGGGRVSVQLLTLLTADRLAKRVAEILRRPVVDDGVDARVEVRQPGADDVDGFEQVLLGRRSVEMDQQQDQVDRQPEKGEDYHDENQKTTDLTLAVRRTRLFLSHSDNTNNSNNNNDDNLYGTIIFPKEHCESSPVHALNAETAPGGCRPLDQANRPEPEARQ